MSLFSQEGRLLRITTSLPADVLLLGGFSGRETISQPFLFELDLFSEDAALDPKDLLDSPVTILIGLPGGADRPIHGIVRRFVQQNQRGPLTSYRAEVVPRLWFLALRRNSRIFQHKSVLDIVETVLKEGDVPYEIKCTKQYPARDYCVQYRESDLDFVSRLLEEEGIFYFFQHEDGKHTLILADSNNAALPAVGATTAHVAETAQPDEDVVLGLQSEHSVYVGKVTLRDYDPLQPNLSLAAEVSGEGRSSEFYDHPGMYTVPEEGDRYAKLRLLQAEAQREVVRGHGTMRSFGAGHKFDLRNHYRPDLNQPYLLTQVQHWATGGDFLAGGQPQSDYRNTFVCIPFSLPYVPQRATPLPTVRGSQTALVVGPRGEEIHVDEHGRVKVQFFWDREGKKDEKSSCWVRVSTAWAGKAWGTIEIPRIGQEVIVDFIEGDPDRPIITGRVYNAEQVPPYTLPANKTQSGLKSRSSLGGGTENYNEIRLEDKKDSELFYIHAEKDFQAVVENDRTETVHHDEKITIANDRTEEVGNDETITIKNNRTEDVGVDETITIGGSRTEEVGGDESITISGARELTVSGNETIKVDGNEKAEVGGNREVEVKGSDKLKVSTSLKAEAGTTFEIKAGTKLTCSAGTQIELKVGGSKIKITPAGIELSAPMIKLKGTALVELKAPIVKGQADGIMQIKGAIAQITADGVLILKGGITMIN